MSEKNKTILTNANAAVVKGDYEGFLSHCTEDEQWTFVGDQTLKGKEAVRRWMAATYAEPPYCAVANMIAEGDFVVALGSITTKMGRRLMPRTATSGPFAAGRSSS